MSPRPADGCITIQARLAPEIRDRLDELARAAGVTRGQLAGGLLAELVPTITAVRPRWQIERAHDGPRH